METKEVIGLDVGLKRTGIARASTAARLAQPLMTVETSKTLEAVRAAAADQPLEAVVVGLPRNLSGDDTYQTEWVRQWVKKAKSELKVPFFWQDEALTSKLAEQTPSSRGSDAAAAAIILQDFLDAPAEERVPC